MGTASRRSHFSLRKVQKYGGSRVLSLTKYLRPDWKYVAITEVDREDTKVVLLIEQVQLGAAHARDNKAHKQR